MEPSGSNVTGRFFCFATPLAREEFASELFILHKDEKIANNQKGTVVVWGSLIVL